jgi:uncharacterized membrane protein
MNKKGGVGLGIIFAIFFFMWGMLMLPLIKDGVTSARDEVGCQVNGSLSDGAKAVCLGLDIGVPIFIVAILTFIGGFIGNKL